MSKKPLEIREKTIFDGFLVKQLLKLVVSAWFKITGWQVTKSVPEGAGITIAAPHTSNWDLVYALSAAILIDVKIYFSIKHDWCVKPLIGPVIMWLGAIPIDRSTGTPGQVNRIKKFVECHKDSRVFFLFTPEGTRGHVTKWKSGFYFIAQHCELPIFLAKIDYRTKQAGVFHTYQVTGDKNFDVAVIQESYKFVSGKFPAEQFPEYIGPVGERSAAEIIIMRILSLSSGTLTETEIASKNPLEISISSALKSLLKSEIVEQCDDCNNVKTYQLSLLGRGVLLHFPPRRWQAFGKSMAF